MDPGYDGRSLVFVVGCPRSGTTWVQRLLATHPLVRTGQESDVFDAYVGPQLRAWRSHLAQAAGGRAVGLASYFREEQFLGILRRYLAMLLEPMLEGLGPEELFVEKTPSHALYIPEILELLPEARVVHVLRDARDVVASLLAASRSWGEAWAPATAGGAAWTWVKHVRATRAAAGGARFHEIRYEDLHRDTARVLRETSAFLGLSWDDWTLAEAVRAGGAKISVGGDLASIARSQANEPVGFVRKARPEAWKEDLSCREKLAVWRVARATMAEVGYTWKRPW